ncbi:MAG: hypothetical protein IKZ02_05175 [Alphaproteobacteria bacterium]|nr:hypothetical protein [Alphaproteobacteria bacterium]
MRNFIFFIFTFFVIGVGNAQMIDVLSNMAIQGQMTGQSAGQISTAFSMIQQNQIVNQMSMIIMNAKMNSNYTSLNKKHFSDINLSQIDWNIGPYSTTSFFIELKNIDKNLCLKLLQSFNYSKKVYINGIETKSCSVKNNVKFIFD